MSDVCLVLMPYAGIERPSLALGLLKASLKDNGIESTALYPNLWFANEIGIPNYKELADVYTGDFLGEWTFSGAAFPEFHPDHRYFLKYIADKTPDRIKRYWRLREQAEAFSDRVAQSVLDCRPKIVSCSSTFYQHCASLALLRRIRALNPEIITIIGGANCEGTMGLTTHQAFPWVDFVCSGEGDDVFARLCQQLLEKGRDLTAKDLPYGVLGPCHRTQKILAKEAPRAMVDNLDQISIPDFDDYFETLKSCHNISPYIYPGLFVETSRGCWWGQKQHCTFCGLNGEGMTYRSKSPERVLQEFSQLSERYGLRNFFVVDNIFDLRYFDTLLPLFAALTERYTIFYETKANLNRRQVKQLAQSGITWIQPGIEHLHDEALALIKKGTTALINVQLLKWAREFGVQVLWNFLVDIPGESKQWYQELMEWLPLIVHLQPPSAIRQIRYDRFSVYHERPQDYGLELVPLKAYGYIYPLLPEIMNDLAYYFEDIADLGNDRENRLSGHHGLEDWVTQWQGLFSSEPAPMLHIDVDEGTQLTIIDTRPCAIKPSVSLSGLSRHIYVECDRALTYFELKTALGKKYGLDVSINEIQLICNQLRSDKILLEINGKLLSLATHQLTALPSSEAYDTPGGYADIHSYQVNAQQQFRDLFKSKRTY